MNIVNVFCIKNDFDRTRFMYVKAITAVTLFTHNYKCTPFTML